MKFFVTVTRVWTLSTTHTVLVYTMKYQKVCAALIILTGCAKQSHDRRLARTYYEQALASRDKHKALNLIDQSLELDDTATQALAYKATLLYEFGKFAESAAEFNRIIENKKVNKAMRADASNNRASALYQLGKTDEAECMWRALTVNAHYISPELAHFNLGLIRLDRALRLRHEFPHERNTEFEELIKQATEFFEQAVAISHEYVDAIFYLGVCAAQVHQSDKARNYLTTVLTIDPDHAPAKQLLDQLSERKNIQEATVAM